MLKLNRKGYLTVEIILASVIAVTIAFFLIEITMKLVSRTDDAYVSVNFITDKALVTKNIKALIENDIGTFGIITNVECSSDADTSSTKYCNITFSDNTKKKLSVDTINKKISYGGYTKKIGTDLSNDVSIKSNVSDNYIMFLIKFVNIFEEENYDVVIPILNLSDSKSVDIMNYEVYLDISGYYGSLSTIIKFDNSGYGPSYDVFASYDQLFKSESSYTSLICYMDEAKTIEYNFEQFDTIRYQYFIIDFTTDIPTRLYCNFSEN